MDMIHVGGMVPGAEGPALKEWQLTWDGPAEGGNWSDVPAVRFKTESGCGDDIELGRSPMGSPGSGGCSFSFVTTAAGRLAPCVRLKRPIYRDSVRKSGRDSKWALIRMSKSDFMPSFASGSASPMSRRSSLFFDDREPENISFGSLEVRCLCLSASFAAFRAAVSAFFCALALSAASRASISHNLPWWSLQFYQSHLDEVPLSEEGAYTKVIEDLQSFVGEAELWGAWCSVWVRCGRRVCWYRQGCSSQPEERFCWFCRDVTNVGDWNSNASCHTSRPLGVIHITYASIYIRNTYRSIAYP